MALINFKTLTETARTHLRSGDVRSLEVFWIKRGVLYRTAMTADRLPKSADQKYYTRDAKTSTALLSSLVDSLEKAKAEGEQFGDVRFGVEFRDVHTQLLLGIYCDEPRKVGQIISPSGKPFFALPASVATWFHGIEKKFIHPDAQP